MLDQLEQQKGSPVQRKQALIAETFGASEKQVSKICAAKRPRRTLGPETRGGYRGDEELQLTKDNIDEAVKVIENSGYEGHDLTKASLRYEAQLPRTSDRTLQKKLKEEARIGRRIVSPTDLDDPAPMYEIESLLARRRSRGKTQYLVKWAGYGHEHNVWYNAEDLTSAQELMRQYDETHPNNTNPRTRRGRH